MKIDKKKLRDIVINTIMTSRPKGSGIRHAAYIPAAWGYEIKQSKGRKTRDGNLILAGTWKDYEGKVWINTFAHHTNNRFAYWYWVGIPRDIAEKILVFNTMPKLIPEKTHS